MHQSDGTGTCTTLLEMHMASVAIVGRLWQKTFYYCKILFLQNEWQKWTLWQRILLSRQTVWFRTTSVTNLLCYKLTPHKWRSSQNGHIIKYLLSEVKLDGKINIFLRATWHAWMHGLCCAQSIVLTSSQIYTHPALTLSR